MKKIKNLLLILLLTVGVVFMGCKENPVEVQPPVNNVPDPVVIFTADPETIETGTSTTLRLEVKNIKNCVTNLGIKLEKDTVIYVSVIPSTTSTYIAKVVGVNGKLDSATVTIVTKEIVVPLPKVTISINPTQVTQGQSVTLCWSSTNATSTIGIGFNTNGATSGCTTFVPGVTATFGVIGIGAASSSDTSYVTAVVNPPIISVGMPLKGGIIIWIDESGEHGLVAAINDQTDPTKGATYTEAIILCQNYGDGYHLPDSTEIKLVKKAKDENILTNFVNPSFAPVAIYISSTELTGNSDWIICIDMNHALNGYLGNNCTNKASHANVRAVCNF